MATKEQFISFCGARFFVLRMFCLLYNRDSVHVQQAELVVSNRPASVAYNRDFCVFDGEDWSVSQAAWVALTNLTL